MYINFKFAIWTLTWYLFRGEREIAFSHKQWDERLQFLILLNFKGKLFSRSAGGSQFRRTIWHQVNSKLIVLQWTLPSMRKVGGTQSTKCIKFDVFRLPDSLWQPDCGYRTAQFGLSGKDRRHSFRGVKFDILPICKNWQKTAFAHFQNQNWLKVDASNWRLANLKSFSI